jgi:hypothetical protein
MKLEGTDTVLVAVLVMDAPPTIAALVGSPNAVVWGSRAHPHERGESSASNRLLLLRCGHG